MRILLPIFCILTLVACVGMSVFTHYWYPYIDEEGKKRSKTKPEEYVSISGCHGNALLSTSITGSLNQLYGDHAQQSAFDNLNCSIIIFLFICIISYNLLQLGHSVNDATHRQATVTPRLMIDSAFITDCSNRVLAVGSLRVLNNGS